MSYFVVLNIKPMSCLKKSILKKHSNQSKEFCPIYFNFLTMGKVSAARNGTLLERWRALSRNPSTLKLNIEILQIGGLLHKDNEKKK